jgi:hypothetical protein
MTGKISRLPHDVREQLNVRMDNGQTSKIILKWVNALPEVQAILKAQFGGQPIDDGNLSEYRKRAFRKWQIHRAALELSSEFAPQDSSEPPPAAPPPIEHFVRWISLRLAAAAESSSFADNPQTELRDIRNFLADIVALRRGELISRRIRVEEQRLAITNTKNEQELEQLFWRWTKRPDIQTKLFPHRDPDKLRRNVVRMLDRELLGRTVPDTDEPEPEPACHI